jgi:alpha-L-rhamnosidase
VFSRLFATGFFKTQADWCAANHLEYQVHLNHEEAQMELAHSEGSFFRDMRYVQVPGVDAIWHQISKDTVSDFPRLASLVAHVYGKPRAFTESFAAYRPDPDVEMVRYVVNEQFVRGINLVEMMYFPASTSGLRQPRSYMGEDGFPELLTYVRRMSYLMSMGTPDASVALLLPTSSLWLGHEATDTAFVSSERLLSEHQIDFDIVSEDAIEHDLKASGGSFISKSGNRYRTVILPNPLALSEAVVARLKTFARSGGQVLFLGGIPQLIPGRSIRDARAANAADFGWAKVVNLQLPATPTPPAQPPAMPPEPQAVPPDVLAAVTWAVRKPTVRLEKSNTGLRVVHRRWKDADVYLFFNEGAAASNDSVTLLCQGQKVETWDPQTATIVSNYLRACFFESKD